MSEGGATRRTRAKAAADAPSRSSKTQLDAQARALPLREARGRVLPGALLHDQPRVAALDERLGELGRVDIIDFYTF